MPPPAGSMRRDIASAYLAIGARIGGLLLVSAVVYRRLGFESFALFNLIRATVGLLNYTGLGLGPAMVRLLAEARQPRPVVTEPADAATAASGTRVLEYARGEPDALGPVTRVYAAGESLAILLGLLGLAAALYFTNWTRARYGMTSRLQLSGPGGDLALGLGLAIVLRLISDAPSSALLVNGRVALDNLLQAATEIIAASLAVAALAAGGQLGSVGGSYAGANAVLVLARYIAAARIEPGLVGRALDLRWRTWKALLPTQAALLAFGVLVTLGQLADFLYSPVDFILIARLMRLEYVGIYAPAVQIDAGLLTLVTGLTAVLLPRTAVAHAGGETARVRRYYLRGTLASTALLAAAAVAVWALSPWILRLWLGRDMPETRAILPLVLVHTVIGGSSAVGRSVLLGMGKVKPFTASVLIAGATNVVLSYVFVRYFGWGLVGIVLGTIVAVVARAGIWTPWYVLRTITPAASAPSSPTSG